MLKTVPKARASHHLAESFDVEIVGVATAVPPHRLLQEEAARRAQSIFPHLAAHNRLFRNTGIEDRYTCEPPEWYDQEHGWEARTEVFLRHALTLLEEVGHASVSDEHGGRRLYTLSAEGRGFLEANRAVVDAIFARIDGASASRHAPPISVLHAMENLGLALRRRLKGRSLGEEHIRVITAALDAAARAVEES